MRNEQEVRRSGRLARDASGIPLRSYDVFLL